MVGQTRQQRPRRHIVDIVDRAFDLAFLAQRRSQIDDGGIFEAGAEIQQHAVGAEILKLFGRQILDRGQGPVAKQRGPVIIGAHLHTALVGADRRRRFDRGVIAAVEIILVVGDVMPPQSVHPVGS